MINVETSIIKSLLFDEEYSRVVLPHLEEEYFDGVFGLIVREIKNFYNKYNKIPNTDALAICLSKAKIPESQFSDILEVVEECVKGSKDLPDTQWMVDETEQYCIDKATYGAVLKSLSIIDGTDKKHDKSAIPDILTEAISINFNTSLGMDFFEDAESRFDLYISDDARIRFPLESLNFLSGGGHKRKALSAVLAGTNVGKSSLMCFLAGEFMKAGLNVVYITLEMSEEDVYERVEANLLDVDTDQIKLMKKYEYISKISKIKQKTNGKLYVKQYPTGTGHVGHFRHFIKELKQKKKFVPDFIFIDYINICASSRYKSLSGVNSYSYVKAIAEELRGLAVELDVGMMTGTQVNRDGLNAKVVDMTSTSESMGLAHTLDFFMSATTDEVLSDNGQQMFKTLKTRWGNKSKLVPKVIGVNFDRMRYYEIGSFQEIQSTVNKTKPKKEEKSVITPDEVEWN